MRKASLASWLVQRGTAALIAPILIVANASTLIFMNLFLFWHLHFGIKEILADYIHHNVTRNLLYGLLRIIIIIVMKYAFVLFVLVF